MSSKVESVRLPARLTGMNRRVTCCVDAIKVSQSETGAYTYARPKIIGATQDLPDGPYVLRFAGILLEVHRRKGVWIGTE